MAPFKFRAAAALDLRRRQEQDAARDLARAEAAFREAERVLASGERAHAQAQQAQAVQARSSIGIAALFWHRNWIARLHTTVADLRAEVRKCAEGVAAAEAAWRRARQRRMALDRLRDRAWARYQAEEQRQERLVIDELARLRFTMLEEGKEGLTSGH